MGWFGSVSRVECADRQSSTMARLAALEANQSTLFHKHDDQQEAIKELTQALDSLKDTIQAGLAPIQQQGMILKWILGVLSTVGTGMLVTYLLRVLGA